MVFECVLANCRRFVKIGTELCFFFRPVFSIRTKTFMRAILRGDRMNEYVRVDFGTNSMSLQMTANLVNCESFFLYTFCFVLVVFFPLWSFCYFSVCRVLYDMYYVSKCHTDNKLIVCYFFYCCCFQLFNPSFKRSFLSLSLLIINSLPFFRSI